jgi:hypothetical protein
MFAPITQVPEYRPGEERIDIRKDILELLNISVCQGCHPVKTPWLRANRVSRCGSEKTGHYFMHQHHCLPDQKVRQGEGK